MWIGTRFGLNRFDREKITVYQEERENPHSLPYNDIGFFGGRCGGKYLGRNLLRIGIFRSWYFPEPAFESSSGNIYSFWSGRAG